MSVPFCFISNLNFELEIDFIFTRFILNFGDEPGESTDELLDDLAFTYLTVLSEHWLFCAVTAELLHLVNFGSATPLRDANAS